MDRFEMIYETLTGNIREEYAIPGVEDLSREGTDYAQAYRTLMEARLSLARRFAVDFEDRDLERMMNAVAVIEKETARGMYNALAER